MKIKYIVGGIIGLFFGFFTNVFAENSPAHSQMMQIISERDRAAAVQAVAQLSNMSVRNKVGTGANVLILGFYISPAPGISAATASNISTRVLARGVGPELAGFRVVNPASNPKLEIYNAAGGLVASNDSAPSDIGVTAASVGAFPLTVNTQSAALLVDLKPGAYTAILTDPTSVDREALIELYDVTRNTGLLRLSNMSVRTGSTPGIMGFAIDGVGQKRILARAIGPGLSQFGITNFLIDPKILLYDASGRDVGSNDNWNSGDAGTYTARSGAFPLVTGSKDAAMSFLISAGGPMSMTVVGTDATSNTPKTGQIVLLELYEVP